MNCELEWTQSHKQVTHQVSFLDLPREIRDLVYGFAFRVSGTIFIYDSNPQGLRPIMRGKILGQKNEGRVEPQRIQKCIPMALMRTCRQMHAESAKVIYGGNIFLLFVAATNFAPIYHSLVRSIRFMIEADHRIYGEDLETVGYWWKRRFWADIVDRSKRLLQRFPNLERLTFPIKSVHLGKANQTWKPVFFAWEHKTKEQRISLAAAWLKLRCPFEDDGIREVLHLELVSTAPTISKDEYQGSRFVFDDEDEDFSPEEFSEAFERMKTL